MKAVDQGEEGRIGVGVDGCEVRSGEGGGGGGIEEGWECKVADWEPDGGDVERLSKVGNSGVADGGGPVGLPTEKCRVGG